MCFAHFPQSVSLEQTMLIDHRHFHVLELSSLYSVLKKMKKICVWRSTNQPIKLHSLYLWKSVLNLCIWWFFLWGWGWGCNIWTIGCCTKLSNSLVILIHIYFFKSESIGCLFYNLYYTVVLFVKLEKVNLY